jgi:dTDP-L-rhamnose 4-epimerase
MIKKILVTGGAGFIGSFLVDALVEKGHRVRIFDNLEPQVHGPGGKKPDYLNPEAEFVLGDILDRDKFAEALRDVEVVFHEAAAVGVGQSMYQVAKYVRTNTLGTANLLDIVAAGESRKLEKMIIPSSMSIYGEGTCTCRDCGTDHDLDRTPEMLRKKQWDPLCPSCGASRR